MVTYATPHEPLLTGLSPCDVRVQVWGDVAEAFNFKESFKFNFKGDFNAALTAARALLPDAQNLKSNVNFNWGFNKTPVDKTRSDAVKASGRPMHVQTLEDGIYILYHIYIYIYIYLSITNIHIHIPNIPLFHPVSERLPPPL